MMMDFNANSKKKEKELEILFVDEGPEKRITDILATNGREVEDIHYTNWSYYYDQDMITMGFGGYDACQKRVRELIPIKSAKILDFGCGTGKFGEMLNSMGYTNIYGIDANKASIDKALEKKAYAQLLNINISPMNKAPVRDGYFDAVVGIDVVGPNAVIHTIFPEIDRLMKRGGYLILFMRMSRLYMECEGFDLKAWFEKLASSGRWRLFPYGYATYFISSHLPIIQKTGVIVTLRKL